MAIRSLIRLRRARFCEPQQHMIVTQPEMEVSACKKKCWRHLVFAQRLSFFIASYLTDEHLEATKSTKHQAQQVPTYLYEMHATYNTIEVGAPGA